MTRFLLLLALALIDESQGFIKGHTYTSLNTRGGSLEASATADVVKVGDKLPAIDLKEFLEERPHTVNLAEAIANKRVVIFGVPGAFTPGCSNSHLPSFQEHFDELKAAGIDAIFCVATNDAYVMGAWGRTTGAAPAIRFLADDAAELTKALGLVMETPNGIRTKRFALVAENNIVTHYFGSEEESSNTWAPSVLAGIQEA